MLPVRCSQKVHHFQTVLWPASAKSFPGKTGRRTARPEILPVIRAGSCRVGLAGQRGVPAFPETAGAG